MLKLYNALTRKIEDFAPLKDEVRVYSCGPTVYDHVHIGNLIAFIFADNINRALELDGYRVKHIMNITDVDDKTIAQSKREYPDQSPEVALKNSTMNYEDTFKESSKSIGNKLDRLHFVRATESIDIIQKLITELLNDGFAYIAEDGIYFSIEAYQKNGKKYGQLLKLDTENTSKARINNDEYDKHSVHDFALWKLMQPDEPAWSFEIKGKDYLGRPGWHIECSAMSTHELGEPFDIHTGGVDLIFPHHENEIAQSTANKANPMYAKYFCHNEHLLVERKKMSKSLGNIYSLVDLAERGFEPLAFRLLVLQSHYRSQANFNWELLDAAKARLNDLRNFASLVHQTKKSSDIKIDFKDITDKIKNAYLNDLNTPSVLAELSNFQNSVQETLISNEQKEEFRDFIRFIDNLLGLDLEKTEDIGTQQRELLGSRETERNNKNWAKSDELRDKLLASNIGVRDTQYGQVWYRV